MCGCFWVALNRRGKNNQRMKQKGDGESPTPTPPTQPPPGQDQSEKLNGAHYQDMGSSSADSKSDPEVLPQQRPSEVTSNLIHSHAIICSFVHLCASLHACTCGCTREWKKEKKSGEGPEKAAVSVGTTGSWRRDWLYKQTFTTLGVWLHRHRMWDRNGRHERTSEARLHHFILTAKSFTSSKKEKTQTEHFSDLQTSCDSEDEWVALMWYFSTAE